MHSLKYSASLPSSSGSLTGIILNPLSTVHFVCARTAADAIQGNQSTRCQAREIPLLLDFDGRVVPEYPEPMTGRGKQDHVACAKRAAS
jgi:hypothetical protein